MMSLDMVRAIKKSDGESIKAFKSRAESACTKAAVSPELRKVSFKIEDAVSEITSTVIERKDELHLIARDLCQSVAVTYVTILLLEHVLDTNNFLDLQVLISWCEKRMHPILRNNSHIVAAEKELVYQNYFKSI